MADRAFSQSCYTVTVTHWRSDCKMTGGKGKGEGEGGKAGGREGGREGREGDRERSKSATL